MPQLNSAGYGAAGMGAAGMGALAGYPGMGGMAGAGGLEEQEVHPTPRVDRAERFRALVALGLRVHRQ